VYSTQSYWVFVLFPSSDVFGSRNAKFRKLDLFPSSGEGGEDTYSVGPLRKSNLYHWNPVIRDSLLLPSPEDGNSSIFRNVVFLLSKTPDNGKSPKTQ
jgi:hypothetical protein